MLLICEGFCIMSKPKMRSEWHWCRRHWVGGMAEMLMKQLRWASVRQWHWVMPWPWHHFSSVNHFIPFCPLQTILLRSFTIEREPLFLSSRSAQSTLMLYFMLSYHLGALKWSIIFFSYSFCKEWGILSTLMFNSCRHKQLEVCCTLRLPYCPLITKNPV